MPIIDIEALRQKVALACRSLYTAGLIDVRGHVSVRVPGTDRILVLGHLHPTRRVAADATSSDVIEVDINGKSLDPVLGPPSEIFIHTGVYRQRHDVGAVAHVHPEFATALSIVGCSIEPISQLAITFPGGVPLLPDVWSISTPECGARLANSLGDCFAILLQGHGAVVVGESIEEATARALVLEQAARLQLLATAIGRPLPVIAESDDTRHQHWLRAAREEYFPTAWTMMTRR